MRARSVLCSALRKVIITVNVSIPCGATAAKAESDYPGSSTTVTGDGGAWAAIGGAEAGPQPGVEEKDKYFRARFRRRLVSDPPKDSARGLPRLLANEVSART